jgi:C-terminal processing protease CtpA/Prc
VWMDGSCGSACEVALVALRSNPHVRFVGKRSAGFTTVNESVPVNKDYVMALTAGILLDHRRVPVGDALKPDVVYEGDVWQDVLRLGK